MQPLRRNRHIRHKYGLEPEDYNQLVKKQKGLCAICHKEPDINKQHPKLVIDHSHLTAKIRSHLCHKCNQALGLFKEDIQSLTNAIEYLKKHKEIK